MRIYALRYGDSEYPARKVFRDGGEGNIPFAWMFWVIRDGSRIHLVDCGVDDPRLLSGYKIRNYRSPASLLKGLHIEKEDISGIIVTHLHADHFDGALAYPDCTFYLQRKEYEAFERRCASGLEKNTLSEHERRYGEFLQNLKAHGKLVLVSGKKHITSSISVALEPFHTFGIQAVVVKRGEKTCHIVCDNAYTYENIEKLRPLGNAADAGGSLQYQKRLKAMDHTSNIVVPGHDPKVFERFPSLGKDRDIVEVK